MYDRISAVTLFTSDGFRRSVAIYAAGNSGLPSSAGSGVPMSRWQWQVFLEPSARILCVVLMLGRSTLAIPPRLPFSQFCIGAVHKRSRFGSENGDPAINADFEPRHRQAKRRLASWSFTASVLYSKLLDGPRAKRRQGFVAEPARPGRMSNWLMPNGLPGTAPRP